MKNIYATNFVSYGNKFASINFESVNEMLEAVRRYSNERQHQLKKLDSAAPIAHIVLGFSGNGKSTFIKNNAQNGDIIISMDTAVKSIAEIYHLTKVDGNMVLNYFSMLLDQATSTGANLWLDGLWLNIMTRLALITTLHEYGYKVFIHSLLSEDYLKKCQSARITDECIKHFGVNYTTENKVSMQKHITDFYENERKTRYVDAQLDGGYMELHADYFIIH